MTNEEKKLEELENAAVKKSNTAKRVAAAAGLMVAGGGAGAGAVYGANKYMEGQTRHLNADDLDEEDLDDVVDAGARQVHKPEEEEPAHNQRGGGGSGRGGQHDNDSHDDDMEVSFDKSTNYYDENGNLVMRTEQGTIDGHDFKLVDTDGDGYADLMAIDENGDGIYSDDETTDLNGDEIAMTHHTTNDEVVFTDAPNGGNVQEGPYNLEEEKGYVAQNEIHNEKEGTLVTDGNEEQTEEELYAYEEEEVDEFASSSFTNEETEDDMFEDLGADNFDMV